MSHIKYVIVSGFFHSTVTKPVIRHLAHLTSVFNFILATFNPFLLPIKVVWILLLTSIPSNFLSSATLCIPFSSKPLIKELMKAKFKTETAACHLILTSNLVIVDKLSLFPIFEKDMYPINCYFIQPSSIH